MQKKIEIFNKKARFQYELSDSYVAGIQLLGSEIKSIRQGKCSIAEAFCTIENNEVFILNMYVADYSYATMFAHDTRRKKKLLLKKREIAKLQRSLQNPGYTLVPTKLFISNKGYAKLAIAIGKGKKLHDKRQTIKDRDSKRDLNKINKASQRL